jgi:hypothetical protein
MENHPIAANSFICFNLWVGGDLLAQSYEHQQKQKVDDNHHTRNTIIDSSHKQHQQQQKRQLYWQWHWQRTAQAASYGALVCAPLYAVWYPWLDKVCSTNTSTRTRTSTSTSISSKWSIPNLVRISTRSFPANSVWAIPAIKVVIDEFLMEPPTIAMFFAYMECCQQLNHGEGGLSWDRIRLDIPRKIRNELPTAWITSLCTWPVVLLATFRFVPLAWQSAVVNLCAIVWDGYLSHRNALAAKHEHDKPQKHGT